MGCCLTSWFSKKQTDLAISTIEAEYVSVRKASQQALWMKQALVDYGVRLDDIPIMCDNKGAIDLIVPLEGLHVDDKLCFVEEPVEIMDQEVKWLKQSRIPIVKVRWNSRRGPEFTWEREDQFQKKYPHLFTKLVPSSSVAT
ncbi:hypothetical protein Tco_0904507 [Tanacetum coccineum]